jgi:hypothetical protein
VVGDIVLYAAGAAFVLRMLTSSFLKFETWAWFAGPAYLLGVVGAGALALAASRLRARRLMVARFVVALAVLFGALVLPLTAEVMWRAERGARYAPAEVVVTERAASEVLRGRDPYSAHLGSSELAGREPSIARHFPYLPAMAAFGVPRALLGKAWWTDARIFFALVTALAAAAALWTWPAPAEQRLRALQVLLVLPTGALVVVTGGDDMPVLALSLLALVLLGRGLHVASALTVAAAAALKLTAWPLLVCLAFAARGTHPRRRVGAIVLAPVAALLAVLPAFVASPPDFADDVFLFPLGLTGLASPARSTTAGSLVMGSVAPSASPGATRLAVTAALVAVALAALVVAIVRVARARRPGPSVVAAAAGGTLLTLVVLAPVARAGYLVYPIDLLAWAFLLRGLRPPMQKAVSHGREQCATGTNGEPGSGDQELLRHAPGRALREHPGPVGARLHRRGGQGLSRLDDGDHDDRCDRQHRGRRRIAEGRDPHPASRIPCRAHGGGDLVVGRSPTGAG